MGFGMHVKRMVRKAGLRAKEIASPTWDMLTDAERNLGSSIHLRDESEQRSIGSHYSFEQGSQKHPAAVTR